MTAPSFTTKTMRRVSLIRLSGLPSTTTRLASFSGFQCAPLLRRVDDRGRVLGGRGDRLQGRQTRLDQEFQFAVQAFALKITRVDGVGAGCKQNPRIAQPRHIAFRSLQIHVHGVVAFGGDLFGRQAGVLFAQPIERALRRRVGNQRAVEEAQIRKAAPETRFLHREGGNQKDIALLQRRNRCRR